MKMAAEEKVRVKHRGWRKRKGRLRNLRAATDEKYYPPGLPIFDQVKSCAQQCIIPVLKISNPMISSCILMICYTRVNIISINANPVSNWDSCLSKDVTPIYLGFMAEVHAGFSP